jgi:hypothetical protein
VTVWNVIKTANSAVDTLAAVGRNQITNDDYVHLLQQIPARLLRQAPVHCSGSTTSCLADDLDADLRA